MSRSGWIAAAAALLFCASASGAQDAAEFYRGKTIRMIVGFVPGGGYDVYARLIARHAPRRIPGNPAIVVENMPGAASMTSVNYVTRIGAQDGTVIGAPGTAPFFAPLTAEAHMFPDPRGLHWLPSPSSDTPVFVVWHETQVRSVADLAQHEIISGSTSKNSPTSFYGRLLAELFNAKIRIVYGYSGGTPEVLAAMEKGEVSAFTNINWASLRVMKAQLLDAGKLRVILQFGSKPSEELPATPFARDLLRSADDRELLDMAVTPYLFGRPYFLGPNVPADRIAMLRRVFSETFADPEFRAEAARLNLDLDEKPLGGDDIQALVVRMYGGKPELIARMQRLYRGE